MNTRGSCRPPPEGDGEIWIFRLRNSSIIYTEHLLVCHKSFRFKSDLIIKDNVIVL